MEELEEKIAASSAAQREDRIFHFEKEEIAIQQQRVELEEVHQRQEQQSESLRLESEVRELELNLFIVNIWRSKSSRLPS